MLFGSEPSSYTDLTVFVMILCSVIVGWIIGYLGGLLSAHQYMTSLIPILNVSQEETSDDYSVFRNMIDDTIIDRGPTAETIDKITKRFSTQKVIFIQFETVEGSDESI